MHTAGAPVIGITAGTVVAVAGGGCLVEPGTLTHNPFTPIPSRIARHWWSLNKNPFLCKFLRLPPVQLMPSPLVVAPRPAQQFWYYCDAARGYYPYVSSCPGGWKTVPATPPGVSE